jgi:hypothetical protein
VNKTAKRKTKGYKIAPNALEEICMDNHFFKLRFLGIGIFLAAIALFSVAVMFLWNKLLPGLFALPKINYWQAAGLLILARMLFGGLGPGHFGPTKGRDDERLFAERGNALREKWMNMSDDERKAFMQSRRGFFGGRGFVDETEKSGKN